MNSELRAHGGALPCFATYDTQGARVAHGSYASAFSVLDTWWRLCRGVAGDASCASPVAHTPPVCRLVSQSRNTPLEDMTPPT